MKMRFSHLLAAMLMSVAVTLTGTPNAAAKGETHLNVRSDNLVTLVNLGSGFGRVEPDGTVERPFVIPERMVLVVTDVEWLALGFMPGVPVEFRVQVDNGDDTALLFIGNGVADSEGIASLSKSFTSGIAIGPSRERPTVELEVSASSLAGPFRTDNIVVVRGYLTDGK